MKGRSLRLLAVPLAILLTVACAGGGDPPSLTNDAKVFDALTAPEKVFPDSKVRALYRALQPEPRPGRRVYSFQLAEQAGMNPDRHFNLVTVAWLAKDGGDAPASTGGPGGSFTSATERTFDGAYRIAVTHGMLMPAEAESPAIAIDRIAHDLAEAYSVRRRNR